MNIVISGGCAIEAAGHTWCPTNSVSLREGLGLEPSRVDVSYLCFLAARLPALMMQCHFDAEWTGFLLLKGSYCGKTLKGTTVAATPGQVEVSQLEAELRPWLLIHIIQIIHDHRHVPKHAWRIWWRGH